MGRRPKPGALKNVGELNDFLLAAQGVDRTPNPLHRKEAKVTYRGLTAELDRLAAQHPSGVAPIYRKVHFNQDPVVDGKYMTRAFESFSTDSNLAVPLYNYELRVTGKNSAVDLQRFNPEQKEALVRPFRVFSEVGRSRRGSTTVIELREEGHAPEAESAALSMMFGQDTSDSGSESPRFSFDRIP